MWMTPGAHHRTVLSDLSPSQGTELARIYWRETALSTRLHSLSSGIFLSRLVTALPLTWEIFSPLQGIQLLIFADLNIFNAKSTQDDTVQQYIVAARYVKVPNKHSPWAQQTLRKRVKKWDDRFRDMIFE